MPTTEPAGAAARGPLLSYLEAGALASVAVWLVVVVALIVITR